MQREKWTESEDAFLRKNYGKLTANEISDKLGRTRSAVKNRVNTLKVYQPAEVKKANCARGQFVKGQTPINKGKKQSDYMSKEAIERTKSIRFHKGNIPHNTKFDGYISRRMDSDGRAYLHIRIGKGKHVLLHRYNWENTYGPIPPGMNVVFKDKNPLNCSIENLELITNEQLMLRNTIHNYPEEITSAIRTLSKLKQTIKKKTNGKEQTN